MEKGEKIIRQVTDIFRKFGYHGTTLSIISMETGLGRSSIYHHFPGGKDAIALASIAYIEKQFEMKVLSRLRTAGGDMSVMDEVKAFLWAYYGEGKLGCLLAAFGSGDTPEPIRKRVSDIFESWIGALAFFYEQADPTGRKKRLFAADKISNIQGALIISNVTGNQKYLESAIVSLGVMDADHMKLK